MRIRHDPRGTCKARVVYEETGGRQKSNQQTRWPIARPVDSYPQSRSPETRKGSFSAPIPNTGLNLAVMSFNIRRGTKQDGRNHWVYRRDLVHSVLNQYRPGILGLQEALDFQISEIRAMLPGYECVGIGNTGGSNELHNTIFYNAGLFVLSDEGTFWLSDTPDIPGSKAWGNMIPRSCTWVRLMKKNLSKPFTSITLIWIIFLSVRERKALSF